MFVKNEFPLNTILTFEIVDWNVIGREFWVNRVENLCSSDSKYKAKAFGVSIHFSTICCG